ncbi:riboflavin biosynthesis protein PYRD, chloroplastic [Aristolochia californica]|uniref:riboflavin biosynthesis protein PYRD, chloroplastic n=1 Tax=Aristolochia californica TaxID=171875 RepID=UPI0035E21893
MSSGEGLWSLGYEWALEIAEHYLICSNLVVHHHLYGYFCSKHLRMHLLTIPTPKLNPNSTTFVFPSHGLSSSPVKCCLTVRVSKSTFGTGIYNWMNREPRYPFLLRNHSSSIGIRCEFSAEKDDSYYMRRCVEVARKALGCTSPNPMVGCVIVKDGNIVGEGFHPKAGLPHAEVFALKDAGVLAENATAYVSLEPCNHYGRTPPCTEALIQAKVKHVVVGMVDPNPIVASKGVERLKEAGIEVKVGVEEESCRKLNEAYIHRMLTGKPLGTLRYSLSVNGLFQGRLGQGADELGGYYSKLLQEYDGIIISTASLSQYSIYPRSREIGAKQPLQIIVATSSHSPLCLPVPDTNQAVVFKHRDVIFESSTESNLHRLGIEIITLDQMELGLILDYCGQRGLCSVLVDQRGDCGGFEEIIDQGLEKRLLQKVVAELLPLWARNSDSNVIREEDLGQKLIPLENLKSKASGASVLLEGYIC